jgi:hypothetical protein
LRPIFQVGSRGLPLRVWRGLQPELIAPSTGAFSALLVEVAATSDSYLGDEAGAGVLVDGAPDPFSADFSVNFGEGQNTSDLYTATLGAGGYAALLSETMATSDGYVATLDAPTSLTDIGVISDLLSGQMDSAAIFGGTAMSFSGLLVETAITFG